MNTLPWVASQCSTCTSSWLESLHWLSSSSHSRAKAGLRALKTDQDGVAGQVHLLQGQRVTPLVQNCTKACIFTWAVHPLSVTWGLDHFLEGAVAIWKKAEDETKPRFLSSVGVLAIHKKHTSSCAVLPENCHSCILWKVGHLTIRTIIVFPRSLSVSTRLVPSRGWNKRTIKQKNCGS